LIVSPDSVVASVRSGEDTEYDRPTSHAFDPTSGTEKWTVSGADSIGTASGEGDIDIIDSAIQTGNLITLVRLGSGPDSTEFLGFYDEATGQQRSVRQLDGAGGMATAANEVYITAYDSDDYEFEIRIFESDSGEPVETVVPAIQGGQRITALEGRDETLVTNAGIIDRSDGSVRATVQIRGDVHSIRSYPNQSILTGVLGVTSVDPTTGAKHWEQQTDGEVVGAPVLTQDAVWVADSFGTLYAFDRTTGRRLLQWDVTESVDRIAFALTDGQLLCATGDRLVAFTISYRESGSTTRPTPLS